VQSHLGNVSQLDANTIALWLRTEQFAKLHFPLCQWHIPLGLWVPVIWLVGPRQRQYSFTCLRLWPSVMSSVSITSSWPSSLQGRACDCSVRPGSGQGISIWAAIQRSIII
jgi:hypothetical protein